jgi:hypothetical protein
METLTELQALQNAANLFNGIVHQVCQDDKRRTTKKYFLVVGFIKSGEPLDISPVLDYDQMNHFILGYRAALTQLGVK